MRRLYLAFTLVELLIVVIIIAVLAAIAIPKFTNASQRGVEASVRTQIGLLRNAVNQFQTDTGKWPASLDDVTVSISPAAGVNGAGLGKPIDPLTWHGPYISAPAIPSQYAGWITYNSDSPPTVGTVSCAKTGTALDGTNYSSW